MLHRTLLCSIFAALLTPCLSRAGTIYVNNITGDDRTNGFFPDIRSQADGPVATISRALKIAADSETVVIANTGTPYSESVVFDRADLKGTEIHPFIIEGNGAILRGAKPLSPEVWQPVGDGTYRYQPYRKGHYQLVVDGKVAAEVQVESMADARPTLQPLQWCAFRGHVYFRKQPLKYINQYEFEAPLFEVGLGLHNAKNVIVRNLNIELYRLDGIAVTGNSRNVRLENIRSTANGRAGLTVTGTSQVQIGGLDLAGNRVADRLVLLKGHVADIPSAQVPPRPSAKIWDLKSGGYVRILSPQESHNASATAAHDSDATIK